MWDEVALESSESMQSVQGTFPGRHHVEQMGMESQQQQGLLQPLSNFCPRLELSVGLRNSLCAL